MARPKRLSEPFWDYSGSEVWEGPIARAGSYPLHPAGKALADLRIGNRIVRKADGGRRPKGIREIPAEERDKDETG